MLLEGGVTPLGFEVGSGGTPTPFTNLCGRGGGLSQHPFPASSHFDIKRLVPRVGGGEG